MRLLHSQALQLLAIALDSLNTKDNMGGQTPMARALLVDQIIKQQDEVVPEFSLKEIQNVDDNGQDSGGGDLRRESDIARADA